MRCASPSVTDTILKVIVLPVSTSASVATIRNREVPIPMSSSCVNVLAVGAGTNVPQTGSLSLVGPIWRGWVVDSGQVGIGGSVIGVLFDCLVS